jgi:hypothetical protein
MTDFIDHETLNDYESCEPIGTPTLLDQWLEVSGAFAMKSPSVISHLRMELISNILETVSASIISVDIT